MPSFGRVKFLPLLGLLASIGVVVSGISIRNSVVAVRAMQTVGVPASEAQGDIQYYMQESRRRFVYAMTTSDPNEQLPYISKARVADAEVQARLTTLVSLDLPKAALQGAGEFRSRWRAYLQVRDEVISLILEGRAAQAVHLESKLGSEAFENASGALQVMRLDLGEHAKKQSQLVQSTLLRVVVELVLLVLTLARLVWSLLSSFRSERDKELAHEREKNEQLGQSARLEAERSLVLELTGKNEPLQNVLEALCRLVQQQLPGSVTAVSIFHDGKLKEIAGVDLPVSFVQSHYLLPAPDGLGASWAALQSGQPVYSLITDDPMWDSLRDAAVQHGFLACWSQRVLSNSGHALGTVDIYFRTSRKPEVGELGVLHGAVQLAATAIDHRRLYEELSFQAQRDALTELANRRLLQERLEQAITWAARDQHLVAVLMIDLDRFKQVNDLLGHRAGDTVLRVVAQRLARCVKQSDTVARVGGDEFTVVLSSVANAEAAEEQAQKMLHEIVQTISLGDQETYVAASIGISLYPSDGQDTVTLLRNADLALYQVKSHGRNGCLLYGPQIGAVLRKKMSMEKALSLALQNNEFHLYYQPQTDIQRSLVGMEALLRWDSPELGRVSPADFIPVAEETGLIVPIGAWVFREACRQSVAWQQLGHSPFKMAVNVSARQLADANFVEFVRCTLAESGLNPEMLELELTETTLMEYVEESLPRLRQLRDLGITLAIDDFGTGYSSLSYLQKLPVASVKIDQSFIREISEDSKSTIPVIQAIVELAHGMGLKVVGEGVETERQMQTLRVLGCDVIQGYLIGKPGPANEIENFFSGSPQGLLQLDKQIRSKDSNSIIAHSDSSLTK